MVVFLLLGVVWAAVLVPPWLQARREARPIASMMSFRSQLWSLQRATPTYGDTYAADDDAYDAYDSYDDEVDDVALVGAAAATGSAAVHALEARRRAPGAVAPRLAGAVPSPDDGVPAVTTGLAGAPAVAARRAGTYRRRRRVLGLLLLSVAGTAAPAVLLGGPWPIAAAVAGSLFVAYVALLIRRGRREAERSQKVRFLTPIRAPRPAVVVYGRGAAR